MTPLLFAGFFALGVVVGAFGTLIGAGGGFLLLPVLIFMYPHESPAVLTAISLAVVCVNASSGSIAYARMRRVDFRSGIVFAMAGLPGAVLGSMVTHHLDRRTFNPILGVVLMIGALIILLRPAAPPPEPLAESDGRTLIEADGTVHRYRPKMGIGIAIAAVVGFVSSLCGIGGGIIHVPAMVYIIGFPIHVATATSHFVLAIVALTGVLEHLADGTLVPGLTRVAPIALGVLGGAQLGARWSSRVNGRWILRSLALALIAVGIRLILTR
jgi:uncharacterized protein